MLPLPIDEQLPALIAALRTSNCVVLIAPTGAGKTTRVPPALLDAGLAADLQIVLLQPRRLAARAAAARISHERGTPLGELAGYEVRFDRRAGSNTRILAVTDGVFVRMLQSDPLLERVGVVLFDEFHERNLNIDLALAMVRHVQQAVRADLKIVAMSATLASQPIAKYLGNCPIVESKGRLYPVENEHVEHSSTEPIHVQTARSVERLSERTTGDMLAFLPGMGEIRRTAEAIGRFAAERDLAVMELYGDLPLERQQAVLAPTERRKIVLATNVAETSVTIPGITGVVDSGWARVLRRDPNLGINRLELERISRASADQRSGRAGRTAPGICLRLWTAAQHRHLPDHDEPEIGRVDLSAVVLELLAWGEADPMALPWFEPPPAKSVKQALSLLQLFGAVDPRGVTDLGRSMARLPVHPRIARLMIEGLQLGHASPAATVAAMLSERDVFERPAAGRRSARHGSNSDVLDRLTALEEFERLGQRDSDFGRINVGAARFVLRARDQLLRLLRELDVVTWASLSETRDRVSERRGQVPAEEAIQRALAVAYLDRLARRRESNSRRALMVGGRGVRLADSCAVTEGEFFVCVDLDDAAGADALVRLASAVDRSWLPAELLETQTEIKFDPQRERVIALRCTRLGDLVLDEAETSLPSDVDASTILAQEAGSRLDLQQLLDDEAAQFIARVQCLTQWMPQLELPRWGDDLLGSLLPELCRGRTSIDELRKSPIARVLESQLTPVLQAALEREAPRQITVPSGRRLPLRYEAGQPPVLAVRIQELFGLCETPRIAAGRVPVLLHLLAPSNRPQQITADLASFWKTTYPQIRNELRRRYPKHSWPDDPLTAQPESRPRRVGRGRPG